MMEEETGEGSGTYRGALVKGQKSDSDLSFSFQEKIMGPPFWTET